MSDDRDPRATHPPAEGPPEEEAEHGGAGESHGPLGNPATDEEALRHRQQEKAAEGSSERGGGSSETDES